MTDDATEWAWRHARSRGNARLAVLAVAALTTGPEATARLGVTEAMSRLGGIGKGTAVKALADAVAAGDLEIAEPGQGRRAALYRIPGAVGYDSRCGLESGPQTTSSGPESGPQTEAAPPLRSGSQTANRLRSGSQTTTATRSGPDSRPQTLWDEQPEKCATRAQASSKSILDRESEGVSATAPASLTDPIPPFARPLVDRITAAKIYVGWDLTAGEWLRLDAMLRRSGVDMLAEHAVTLANRQTARGESVGSARYFLRAWTNLPPAPTAGTIPAAPAGNVIPLDARRSPVQRTQDLLAQALADMEAQQQ